VRDRLGLSLINHANDLEVEFVSPGGPAEAVGFKTGERVTLIDRKPQAAWPADALRTLAEQPAGTLIEFTLEGGQVRRVKLADYF
jgi:predicted metalloprotease with PDZ domain